MPGTLYYLFVGVILALSVFWMFSAPIKTVIYWVGGKSPFARIPKCQYLLSCALSFAGACCSFFFYAATKGNFEAFSYFSIYLFIQACLMLILSFEANASAPASKIDHLPDNAPFLLRDNGASAKEAARKSQGADWPEIK